MHRIESKAGAMPEADASLSEAFNYAPGQSLGYLVRDTSRLFARSL